MLGVLIARVSGKSFEAFLRERLFDPLGMKDTAFSVPASKLDRLPGCYRFNHDSKKFEVFDSAQNSEWSRPPAFESGAGGLVSTVDDYYAFCRMMLNEGVWGRERLLAQASVEAMTSDQLTPEQRKGAEIFFGNHSSWGFGMAVNIRAGETLDGAWTIRLGRRLRHVGVLGSEERLRRHPADATPDGFTGTTGGVQRFLDACVSFARSLKEVGLNALSTSHGLRFYTRPPKLVGGRVGRHAR